METEKVLRFCDWEVSLVSSLWMGTLHFRESAWLGSGVNRGLGKGLWHEQRMRQR